MQRSFPEIEEAVRSAFPAYAELANSVPTITPENEFLLELAILGADKVLRLRMERNLIQAYAEMNDVTKVNTMLKEESEPANRDLLMQRAIFGYAAKLHLTRVENLLSTIWDKNKYNKLFASAIRGAASQGHLAAFKQLLMLVQDKKEKDELTLFGMRKFAEAGCRDIVESYLAQEKNNPQFRIIKKSMLLNSATGGHFDYIKYHMDQVTNDDERFEYTVSIAKGLEKGGYHDEVNKLLAREKNPERIFELKSIVAAGAAWKGKIHDLIKDENDPDTRLRLMDDSLVEMGCNGYVDELLKLIKLAPESAQQKLIEEACNRLATFGYASEALNIVEQNEIKDLSHQMIYGLAIGAQHDYINRICFSNEENAREFSVLRFIAMLAYGRIGNLMQVNKILLQHPVAEHIPAMRKWAVGALAEGNHLALVREMIDAELDLDQKKELQEEAMKNFREHNHADSLQEFMDDAIPDEKLEEKEEINRLLGMQLRLFDQPAVVQPTQAPQDKPQGHRKFN